MGAQKRSIKIVYYITSVESDESNTSGDVFARGGAKCEKSHECDRHAHSYE